MPRTNGHVPKRAILWAILYARVSTDEQARSGYSLAQQLEALRAYCEREGYEILEEVVDVGQSGASLERPGMDRVRDLVAAGGVYVVLAQDRDRFSREPAYTYLLRREFKEHGCELRSLNDRGDESPEGELTDGILDQLAKYERAKIAERSRRGKLQKVRQGKVMAGRRIKYGFKLNVARDGLLVDEEKMRTVRRIFRMVGVEGLSQNAVYNTFTREGIPTPGGGKHWDRRFFRACILDDAYRPHSFEEVKELVTPSVAAGLDPDKSYGIWWFNQRRVQACQVSESSQNGRRYRVASRTTIKPKDEWVAVPVPESGIPREIVDAARMAIKDNRRHSSAGRRFWELSGGIIRCGVCRNGMQTRHYVVKGKYQYGYYRCRRYQQHGDSGCDHRMSHRGDKIEATVWEFVSDLLQQPERLQQGLDEMIEQERAAMRGDPEQVVKVWLDKLAEVDQERRSYQRLAAKGHMSDEELDEALGELEDTRKAAERELRAIQGKREIIEQLERDRDTILEYYAGKIPEALDELTSEERHRVYRMLRLEVYVQPNGDLEIRGVIRAEVRGATIVYPEFCTTEATQTGNPKNRVISVSATSQVRVELGTCASG